MKWVILETWEVVETISVIVIYLKISLLCLLCLATVLLEFELELIYEQNKYTRGWFNCNVLGRFTRSWKIIIPEGNAHGNYVSSRQMNIFIFRTIML